MRYSQWFVIAASLGAALAMACSSEAPSGGGQGGNGNGGGSSSTGGGGGGVMPVTQPVCTKDGWCWSLPGIPGNDFAALWRAPNGELVAVGECGTVQRQSGNEWIIELLGDDDGFDSSSVWGTGPNDIYVVGRNYTGQPHPPGFHFDGTSWTALPIITGLSYAQAVWGTGPTDMYIIGRGGIAHSTGGEFSLVSGPPTDVDFRWIWGSGPNDVFVVGAIGGSTDPNAKTVVWHYDGTWTGGEVGNVGTYPESIWGSGPKDVYLGGHYMGASGAATALLHYDGTWTDVPSKPGSFGVGSIAGIDATNVFFAARGGFYNYPLWSVWKYDAPAQAYTEINPGFLDTMATVGPGKVVAPALLAVASDDVYLAGPRGRIARFDGTSWNSWQGGKDFGLVTLGGPGIWASSPTDVFAVGTLYTMSGYENTIWRFDGTTWSSSPMGGAVNAIWGSGSKDVFAVGNDVILHWDGASFSALDRPGTRTSVWGTAPTDVIAVGHNGLVERYDGTSWTTLTDPLFSGDFNGVWVSATNEIFVAGDSKILHYDGAWSEMILPDGSPKVAAIWGSAPNDVYAVGGSPFAKAWHYDGNAQKTWTSIPLPAGIYGLHAVGGRAGDVYIAGEGKVLHGDGAGSWSIMRTGSNQYSNGISVTSDGTAFAIGPRGVLVRKP